MGARHADTLETLRAELAEVGPEAFTSRAYRPRLVRHIVLFRLRPEVTPAEREEIARRFRALAETRRPDGARYIVSIEVGEQASGERAGRPFDLGIVVTFASVGDRNYYVGSPVIEDPRWLDASHAKFKKFVGPFVDADGVQVFDIVAE